MNKADFILKVATETSNTVAEVAPIVEGVFDTIVAAIKEGDKVKIKRFGVFDKRMTPNRTITHPQTKEKIEVKSRPVPTFYPSKVFKNILRGEDSK
jgi:nucleoid DNA-binding protein